VDRFVEFDLMFDLTSFAESAYPARLFPGQPVRLSAVVQWNRELGLINPDES